MMDGRILLNGLKGAGIALLLALALLLPAAAILLKLPDPEGPMMLVTHLLQLLSGGIGAFLAARWHRERGMLIGSLSGFLQGLVLLVGSLIAAPDDSFLTALLFLLATVGVGLVGGLLGTPGEKSSLKRRKAMMKKLG